MGAAVSSATGQSKGDFVKDCFSMEGKCWITS